MPLFCPSSADQARGSLIHKTARFIVFLKLKLNPELTSASTLATKQTNGTCCVYGSSDPTSQPLTQSPTVPPLLLLIGQSIVDFTMYSTRPYPILLVTAIQSYSTSRSTLLTYRPPFAQSSTFPLPICPPITQTTTYGFSPIISSSPSSSSSSSPS